jgi:Reverse transcriptase (RNA-dependent DNA polymerase)
VTNPIPALHPVPVQVANNQYMHSTHTAELPFPALPHAAKQVHVFPDLHSSLLAVAPLCDAGCTVTFDKHHCIIRLPDNTDIQCQRNPQGLWVLPPHILNSKNMSNLTTCHETARPATGDAPEYPPDTTPTDEPTITINVSNPNLPDRCPLQANPVMNAPNNTPADLVAFAHAALFSPAISTLKTALDKGFLPPFTGLTATTLARYPPSLDATAMGHLDAQRKNTRSTKAKHITNDEELADAFPPQPKKTKRTNACFLTAMEPKNIVYSDQTGRLPHPSSTGNNYLVIAYDYDSNNILLRPVKSRSATHLTEAIAGIHTTLTRGGCQPQFHRLDNECSQELKGYFDKADIQYQLAPPHEHRSNAAERAIRTAKNHLAAGWWSTDPTFPMHLWDKTIPQAELTLNLLRHSRINPNLSAWEQLHGKYDFNRTPIAPPGIRVKAHARPAQRQTWAPHTFDAWYVGPALDHYRCYTVWATRSRQTRIVNQLMWFPHRSFPRLDNLDLLRATVEDAITILRSPPSETFVSTMEEPHRKKLVRFFDTLQQEAAPPSSKKATGGAPAPSLGVPTEQPRRSPRLNPGMSLTAVNPDTGALAEYKELVQSTAGPRWELAMNKELGRLFQGYTCKADPAHTVQGTDTCTFIRSSDIPKDKKTTYVRIVADYREQKADPYRVRCTVGGDRIDFQGDVSTKVADLVTVKCLLNHTISTPGARAACIDIKDFYLNNPLPSPEFVRFRADTIPKEIWDQYGLDAFVVNGWIYARVDKGMYGLPQAGKVASDNLIPRLNDAGYHETGIIPGLFMHDTNGTLFTLIVDDFLIHHIGDDNLQHLEATLRKYYTITVDKHATKFCGMTLDWNYQAGHVTLSMPGYVEKALQRFTHQAPAKPQHAPHQWTAPNYGAKVQYADPDDDSMPLDAKGITLLQQIIGTFLYYARAIDNTMLVALGTLAAAQTKGTEQTMEAAIQLLNYAASNPNAAIRFHSSDMVLYAHSDASYLSEPHARSRVGGYFYLGNNNEPADNPTPNGPIHVESRIMRNVMAAASEAEIGALFHNGQEAAHIRNILKELGREQQQPTRITTDNSTADGFANGRTKIRRSKAMDMRFYWVQDRVKQGQLKIHWQKGELNLADYFTKHHPASHHRQLRPTYLYVPGPAPASPHYTAYSYYDYTPDRDYDNPHHRAHFACHQADTPIDCRGVLIRVPDSEPVSCEPACHDRQLAVSPLHVFEFKQAMHMFQPRFHGYYPS